MPSVSVGRTVTPGLQADASPTEGQGALSKEGKDTSETKETKNKDGKKSVAASPAKSLALNADRTLKFSTYLGAEIVQTFRFNSFATKVR